MSADDDPIDVSSNRSNLTISAATLNCHPWAIAELTSFFSDVEQINVSTQNQGTAEPPIKPKK